LARQAVALDPADAEARACLSNNLRLRGDHIGALAEAERALALCPNLAGAHGALGVALTYSGRPQEGLASLQTSVRLDPHSPSLAFGLHHTAVSLYFSREYEAAVEADKLAIRSYPDVPQPYRWLAAALGQTGRAAEAREALEKAIAVVPASFDRFVRQRAPWIRPEDHAHMVEGLRKAGWKG
jgi:adenylate cyclase